jgi:hypothetical protein
MKYSELKSRIVDFHWRKGARKYAICNEFGLLAIVYASHEGDALDAAVDANLLDCQRMSDDDYAEYEANGWDDSFICAGNASEPFWSNYLSITDIT